MDNKFNIKISNLEVFFASKERLNLFLELHGSGELSSFVSYAFDKYSEERLKAMDNNTNNASNPEDMKTLMKDINSIKKMLSLGSFGSPSVVSNKVVEEVKVEEVLATVKPKVRDKNVKRKRKSIMDVAASVTEQ